MIELERFRVKKLVVERTKIHEFEVYPATAYNLRPFRTARSSLLFLQSSYLWSLFGTSLGFGGVLLKARHQCHSIG